MKKKYIEMICIALKISAGKRRELRERELCRNYDIGIPKS